MESVGERVVDSGDYWCFRSGWFRSHREYMLMKSNVAGEDEFRGGGVKAVEAFMIGGIAYKDA